jgi:hypothetical protein
LVIKTLDPDPDSLDMLDPAYNTGKNSGKKSGKKILEYLIRDRGLDLVEECSELLVREPGDPEEMQHL